MQEQAQEKKYKDTDLFRKVALNRLSNPEQLDRLIQVTAPRDWIVLATVSVLLTVFVGWTIFGRIRTTVEGRGLLAPAEQQPVQPVFSFIPGRVVSLAVKEGQFVQSGQVIAVVADAAGEEDITTPISGKVMNVMAQVGQPVSPQAPLIMVESAFIGRIYVPFGEAQQIKAGMKVEISPVTVPLQEFGFIHGEVVSVGEFPARDENAEAFAGNEEVVIEVQVALNFADTPTGYEWSFAEGPDTPLRPNTPCLVKIVTVEERPISRVFPVFD